jgi:hypothetical protein
MDPHQARTRLSEPPSAHTPGDGKSNPYEVARPPKRAKVAMPMDIVISLLRPDELEKLQKYVASYVGKHLQP